MVLCLVCFFFIYCDNEVYKKNVKIGEQISILLKSDKIPEKSLKKKVLFRPLPGIKTNNGFRKHKPPTMAKPASWYYQGGSNGQSEDYLGDWTRG